ncbi:hypothetical protein K437DRAFT_260255 [Tilletiaria anomala UBC 951]|uniref:Pre-mRNA-splicing factor SLU7 n=1 Tax=Tilletiaria anomala (strain ATCC 24038 / CBS 436.72 / UBC 951) TaxID=1037660 RepID=A0A066VBQ0_TILAU|nr:uncharacterized protein K437DRAFT_260255 [Tilletiaria anomala UBC 951]KDN36015.1 hypothetical protein K437DRAFT_260255 [Tilletiaria anomala UBC 951]
MSTVGKLSREEFRRQKDLDAARKAGTAPAEVDEEGNAINPHIPQFMAQAPWYLDSGRPSLKHQRKPETGEKTRVELDEWYARGEKAGPAATKYRKGACENCGAMSHKTKDCLERPRKKGAKWTGKDIAADEVVRDVKGLDKDWDAKRDRWNGYDPSNHKRVIESYNAIEEARRKLREEEIDKQGSSTMTMKDSADPSANAAAEASALHAAKKLARKSKAKDKDKPSDDDDFGTDSSDEQDEDKYAEKANMVGQKVDTVKRISVRNLRIREDRAKYLYNLNPESSYYDPKTRSMREAPDPNLRPEDAHYAGDNFHRASGDSVAMQKLQLFAWQAESHGNDLHLQANPTVNELQFKQFQERKEDLIERNRSSILERYGGAEHFDSVPKELRDGQTENYVEYSRTGQVVKGQQKAKPKSKYEEDVFDQNHTAVWGSWYDLVSGQWGYGCCRSTMKGSYCTGKAGIEATRASQVLVSKPVASSSAPVKVKAGRSGRDFRKEKSNGKRRKRSHGRSRSASFSSSSSYSSSGSSSESERDDHRDSSRRSKRRRSTSHHSRQRRRSDSFSSSSTGSYSSASESDASDRHKRSSGKKRKTAESFVSRKHLGEGDVSAKMDKDKLKEALKVEERRQAELRRGAEASATKPDWLKEAEDINNRKGSKKGFNSLNADDENVTEEQLEAFRMKRQIFDDPMANFKDNDDGV